MLYWIWNLRDCLSKVLFQAWDEGEAIETHPPLVVLIFL